MCCPAPGHARVRGVSSLPPLLSARLLLPLGLFLGHQARAQGSSASTPLLVVALDDRDTPTLIAPALHLELPNAEPVDLTMLDDGSLVGDVPGDGIWMASHAVPGPATIGMVLRDGERSWPRIELAAGVDARTFLAFKHRADGSLVPDPGARPVAGVGDPRLKEGDPLVVQAAPVQTTGADAAALDPDQVRVRVSLDDRAASRTKAPRLAVDQPGVDTVSLADDGTAEGDTAKDGIWLGELVVRRTQYLALSVLEGDRVLAKLTVFLPSTGQAEIHLRTTEGDPAVELAAEPQATGESAAPGGPGGAPAAGGGAQQGVDRLGAVLWTLIALFSIAFAWVRGVAWRTWRDEVRPLLVRLERHLDGVEAAGRAETDKETLP